jgi:hypothetical protein
MKKLEEFNLWLAASHENDTRPNPLGTSHPPPSVPPSEAKHRTGSTTPMQKSTGNTFSEQ